MRPITDVLIEFPRTFIPMAEMEAAAGALVPAKAFEADAMDRALAGARQAGLDVGREAAEAAAASELERLRETHAAALIAARAQWAAQEGDVLAAALQVGLQALEAEIAHGVAAVLMPVLEASLRTRVAAELATAVGQLMTGGTGAVIELAGPADLTAPVAAAFADTAAVAVSEAPGSEVSLRAGDTRIVSQIGAWSARLAAVLEGTA